MVIPIGWITSLIVASLLLGAYLVKDIGITPDSFPLESLKAIDQQILGQFRQLGFFSASSVLTIWWHNLRAVTIAMLLGSFSLGVVGGLVLMLPMIIIGFFTGLVSLAGYSPWVVLAAVTLPHGIFEIPAIILSGAAILRVGATLVIPHKDQSIGEGVVSSIADWAKVTLVVVIPLFLGAAILEVFYSPQMLVKLLGTG
jgi:uncharacterized membrane protein SpoIIM required for sporulation